MGVWKMMDGLLNKNKRDSNRLDADVRICEKDTDGLPCIIGYWYDNWEMSILYDEYGEKLKVDEEHFAFNYCPICGRKL